MYHQPISLQKPDGRLALNLSKYTDNWWNERKKEWKRNFEKSCIVILLWGDWAQTLKQFWIDCFFFFFFLWVTVAREPDTQKHELLPPERVKALLI